MKIWALADLHLPFGSRSKSMEVFGPDWSRYTERIEENWRKRVKEEDLMLIPGDISWAMNVDEAKKDLEWIDALPGKKVILKGNHDYWWPSNQKLQELLPASIDFIHNRAITIDQVTIAGSRLWDSPHFNFQDLILVKHNPLENKKKFDGAQSEKIYLREIERLKLSLDQMDRKATFRIAMTHYPPLSVDLKDSPVSQLFETYAIDVAVFGHLHSVKRDRPLFGEKNQVRYLFAAADYLSFDPILVKEL